MENENINLLEPYYTLDEATILDESVVLRDPKYNYILEVHTGDARFQNTPYFKLSKNGKLYNTATPATRVRISLEYVCYIYHNDGKGIWELNSSERKHLMDVLKRTVPVDGMVMTVWDAIFHTINKESKVKIEFKNTTLLDYTKLDPKTKYDDHYTVYA